MEVRCFGGLSVRADGVELDLGRPKQRLVLALLVVEAGRVVATEGLLGRLWGDDAGQKERAALQAYMSNLRRVLGDGDATEGRRILVHQGHGYRLAIDRSSVDALRFEDLVARGFGALRSGDAAAGAAAFEAAMAEWRADPLPEFGHEPAVFGSCERWRALRGAAAEQLAELHLDARRPELAAMVVDGMLADFPLRERLHRAAALARYRLGRQSEALEVLTALRTNLRESAGLDPSPESALLEQRILDHDAAIGERRPPDPVVATHRSRDPLLVEELFGRERELELLQATLGVRALVSVIGAPGAGKTALVHAAVAAADPAVVCRIRCPESGAAPYWPVVSVVHELAAALDVTARSFELTGADRADPFAVAQLVLEVLRRCPASTVVVIDDVQWADVDTLRVLAHVVGDLGRIRGEDDPAVPTLVLVSRDPQPDETDELAVLRAEITRAGAVTLDIEPLDEPAIELWVSTRLPTVEPSIVAAVHRRTGGNPLFARELMALLAGSPHEDPTALLSAIPPGVRSVVRRRVSQLPATTQRLLAAASIVAPTFDVAVVADMVGLATSDVLHQLQPAIAADLLATDVEPGTMGFSHDIVAESLAAELGLGRRAELHAAAARSIARRRPDDASASLVTFHAALGAPAGTAELAVDSASRGARAAVRRGAYSEAARLRDRALAVMGQTSGVGPAELLRATLDAARAHERADAMPLAVERVRAALSLALQLGDAEALGEAGRVLCHPSIFPNQPYGVVDHELVNLLESALERLDSHPTARADVLGALATELFHSSDTARRQQYATAAVAVARAFDDPALLARALHASTFAGKSPAATEARLGTAREIAELAVRHQLGDDVLLMANLQSTLCQFALGRLADVSAGLRSCRELIERPVGEALRSQVGFLTSHFELVTGGIVAAQASADAADRIFRRSRPLEAPATLLAQELSLAHELGDVDGPLARVAQVSAGPHGYGAALRLLAAAVLVDHGRADEARAVAGPVLRAGDDDPGDYLSLFQAVAQGVVTAGDGEGDSVLLGRLRDRLQPFRGHWVSAGTVGGSLGFVDLALARIDVAMGDEAAASADFDAALDLHRRAGATTWLGWTLLHHGRYLLQLGSVADARAALDEAQRIARSIGSPALADQITRTRR